MKLVGMFSLQLRACIQMSHAHVGLCTLSAGGRYDKLVGMFSGKDVPAVGASRYDFMLLPNSCLRASPIYLPCRWLL
jgi:hypothetical protein